MKKFTFAIAAIVGCLFAHPAAEAGFLYVDVFDGTTHLFVQDGDALDSDGANNNSVTIVNSALLTVASFASKLSTSGSSVTSSSNQEFAASQGLSTLSTQFVLKGNGTTASDFTVTSGQTDFVVPGDPKKFDSSGSFTFGVGAGISSATFQGSAGTTNGASDLLDTLISGTSTAAATSFGGGDGAGFIFNNGNTNYSMTNVLTAHIAANIGVSVQNQGTSTVSVPVPEPSTIVMLVTLACPVAACAYRRRRSAK